MFYCVYRANIKIYPSLSSAALSFITPNQFQVQILALLLPSHCDAILRAHSDFALETWQACVRLEL